MTSRALLSSLALAAAVATMPMAASAGSPEYVVDIVLGSCAEPGELVAATAPVGSVDELTAAPPAIATVTASLGADTKLSQASVPRPLQEVIAAGHAIRVHDGSGAPETVLSCGEYAGTETAVTDLQIGLAATGSEGLDGMAWLHDNGDGTTSATVVVASSPGGPTVAADDAPVEVVIERSLYQPSPLEIEAGTTVTWVNEDALPHTTTATEGGFDSGYMATGARWSHTFETPGEYRIFCVYHPRMRSVVIVN